MRERRTADLAIPVALAVAALVLHWLQGRSIGSPWRLPEELDVARAARTLAGVGSGGGGTLYSVVTAPLWSGSVSRGYELAKLAGAFLVAVSAVPTYALARRRASTGWAVAATVLAVAAPATVASSAVTPLPLAYLLTTAGLLALDRVVVTRRLRDGGVPLLLLALAAAAWPPALWLVVPALALATLALAGRRAFRWPGAAALVIAPAVAYAGFHLARRYSTAFAVGTDQAARSLIDGLEYGAGAIIGVGLFPIAGLALGALKPALVACTLFTAAAVGAGILHDSDLLLLAVPVVAAAAAWAASGAVPRRLRLAASVVAAAILGGVGRSSWTALDGLLGLDVPELAAAIALTGAVVVLSVVIANGMRPAARWAAPSLAAVALAAAVAGEVGVARDARAAATARGMLPTRTTVAVLTAAATPQRTVDALLFWNPNAAAVDVTNFHPDAATGELRPPLPRYAAYLDLAGLGLAGRELGRVAGAPLVRPTQPPIVAATLDGVYPDGWTGDHAVYRRFVGAARGRVYLSLSRAGWKGPPVPGGVIVSARPLGGQPAFRRALHVSAGKTVRLTLPAPGRRFEIDVASQTFSPAAFGGSDTRRLGVQLNIDYVAG